MKVAIYIDQGVTQLVLTPESDWEKSAISSVQNSTLPLAVSRGEFYECRGGWVREGGDNSSLILRIPKEHQS